MLIVHERDCTCGGNWSLCKYAPTLRIGKGSRRVSLKNFSEQEKKNWQLTYSRAYARLYNAIPEKREQNKRGGKDWYAIEANAEKKRAAQRAYYAKHYIDRIKPAADRKRAEKRKAALEAATTKSMS